MCYPKRVRHARASERTFWIMGRNNDRDLPTEKAKEPGIVDNVRRNNRKCEFITLECLIRGCGEYDYWDILVQGYLATGTQAADPLQLPHVCSPSVLALRHSTVPPRYLHRWEILTYLRWV